MDLEAQVTLGDVLKLALPLNTQIVGGSEQRSHWAECDARQQQEKDGRR